MLTALGYDVTLLAARVCGDEGRLGILYDHLALRVRTDDGGDWLADVGFGSHFHLPLVFAERREQRDPVGVFRVVDAEAADLDVLRDGRPVYRLETRPRALGDFTAGAWWHRTSPHSHFTRSLVCSRVTADGGRITLSGRRLTRTAPDGTREERGTGSDAEVLAIYRDEFGIVLDAVPGGAGRADGRLSPYRTMSRVSDVRHVLVLPDRDAAEEVAEALEERFGVDEEPRLVRDALAGRGRRGGRAVARPPAGRGGPAGRRRAERVRRPVGRVARGAVAPASARAGGDVGGPWDACRRWPGRTHPTTCSPP